MRFASTFAGIGGFDLGFEREGMTCTMQVEKDRQRSRVLANHWPTTPRGEDIRDISGSDLGRPDLLVGGFPCKDLSIGKGKRKGLAGAQSGLYWEFHRLVDEHLRLVDAARPRWTVLENVPGLLSSNGGRDMAAVVLGLEQLGYGWAYRVVDSRAVGSAQRRPRVLIVGHRGGDARPAWDVLADGPGRGIAPGVRGEQAGEVGPGSGGRSPFDGVEFFRKSARPRGKAEDGHYATWVRSDFANVLNNNDGRSTVYQTHLVVQDDRLRALTPVEWERLQGFPDNWTAGMTDKERYAALGDAMNVNLAQWLGRRLMHVEKALPMLPLAS